MVSQTTKIDSCLWIDSGADRSQPTNIQIADPMRREKRSTRSGPSSFFIGNPLDTVMESRATIRSETKAPHRAEETPILRSNSRQTTDHTPKENKRHDRSGSWLYFRHQTSLDAVMESRAATRLGCKDEGREESRATVRFGRLGPEATAENWELQAAIRLVRLEPPSMM